MALPKKGSRLITLAGVTYRYKVVGRINTTEVFIEQDNVQGQKLYATSKLQGTVTVTPSIVKRIITAAIEKGWKPDEKGKRFSGLLIEDYVSEV